LSILLDTNVCVAVMNGEPPSVRERFKHAFRFNQPILLSSVSLFELWFSIAKGTHAAANTKQLSDFCETVDALPFDEEDARSAAYIRAELMRAGRPIGAYDLLIAAQAVRRNLLLVSADREFSRVKGLRWENWAA
jgi:tRNA(fMet)-specific endonuclease VapC